MADQTAEQLQNMSLQDYDSSEFDPLSPQNCKAGNFPYTDTQGVDLLGDTGADLTGVTNGHGKNVLFDDESMGLPDPTYVGQSQPAKKELFQRHMSTGEILGYQNEYGESGITGQMEYGMDSDDEECDNNLVNFADTQNQSSDYPVDPVDQAYLLSTGQPLVDFSNDIQTVPPVSEQQDLLEDNFDDYSSPVEYQNQDDMDDKEYFDSVDPYYAQAPVENDYPNDNIDPNNWQPELDEERSRRSLSPERSMSPKRQEYSQSEGAEGVTSPQCDTESYDNLDSIDESSYSESLPAPVGSVQEPVIPNYEGDSSDRSHVDYSETDSVTSDASGVPRFKSGVPRPRKIKKPKALPPWNDNVVIPKKPKPRPTFIGNKEYLPTASSSPDRPQTAPVHFVAKDASSDSGVEDDKTQTRMNSADSKKYGTDSKNDKYKPGGGQIQIFSKKLDTKHVSPRTDTKTPKSALTPRSPVKSPTPQRASTPNTRQVQSKIGSLNNVKHSPGGGNIAIVSNKPDFSNVKSKVGSKDKIDHKPKGGDKKIESKKLDWKVESKVGSLKNATHVAGGGNLKDDSVQVKGTMNTRENIGYTPGGGNVPEPWEEDLEWDADAQVNSLDNLDYTPGGGKVRIFSERLSWNAEAKVDTGLYRRSDSQRTKASENRYDSARQEVSVTIEQQPDSTKNDTQGDHTKSVDTGEDQSTLHHDDRMIIPPPKPPRCIHKQWEIEYLKEKKENEEKEEEDETCARTGSYSFGNNFETLVEATHTKTETESEEEGEGKADGSIQLIGFKRNVDEISEVKQPSQAITGVANNKNVGTHIKGMVESTPSSGLKNRESSDKELSSRDVTDNSKSLMADITNDDEVQNKSLDRTETHVTVDKVTSISTVEKENRNNSMKIPKKTGFGSKFKDMISSKKKVKNAENAETPKSRFSSTSKKISRTNSKKRGEKDDGKDKDEATVMTKYLGYVSPKLLKTDGTRRDNKIDKTKIDAKVFDEKKQSDDKMHIEKEDKEETIEKIANLGYESPKLAKKVKDVVLTGNKKKQKEGSNKQPGAKKGLVKRMAERFSRNGALKQASIGVDRTSGGSYKGGVHGDYQEIDFVAKAIVTRSYKINDTEEDSNGVINPAFDSDVDSDDSGTDEEREVSYAKIMMNQGSKNTPKQQALQTSTFRFKADNRPTSPYNEIKQELVEVASNVPSVPSSETVAINLLEDSIGVHMAENGRPVHDPFGYSIVNKSEDNVLHGTKDSSLAPTSEQHVVKHKDKKEDETKVELSMHDFIHCASNLKSNVENDKSKSNAEDEKCLSLDDELRQALAGIGEGDKTFLKTLPQNEGTVLGSRPGTPKISVKPIRLKAEEEARSLSYSSSFSVRGMDKSQTPSFDRSQRYQSMNVQRTSRSYDSLVESQSGQLVRASARLLYGGDEAAGKGIEEGVGEVLEEHASEKFDYKSNKVVPHNNGITLADATFLNDSHLSNLVTVGIGDVRYGHCKRKDFRKCSRPTMSDKRTEVSVPEVGAEACALRTTEQEKIQRCSASRTEIKVLQVKEADCKYDNNICKQRSQQRNVTTVDGNAEAHTNDGFDSSKRIPVMEQTVMSQKA